MKKLFAILLTLVFVMSMGSAVFATDPDPTSTPTYSDSSPITINKALTASPVGSNPAETFNFTIGNGTGIRDGVTLTAPAFNPATFSITVLKGEATGLINTIGFPVFDEVGEFTYEVKETSGTTAGFNYDTNTYFLKITVINNPAFDPTLEPSVTNPKFLRVLTLYDGKDVKTDSFQNTFDAGDLTIKKESVGNFADPDDTFTVTVTLTPKTDFVLNDDVIEATGSDSYAQNDTTGVVTIKYTVKHGSVFTITDIPYDVTYTVVESANTKNYVLSYDGNETGEIDDASIETMITNTRNKEIDTGISLDSLPYILLLLAAAIGMGVLLMKKRKNTDF